MFEHTRKLAKILFNKYCYHGKKHLLSLLAAANCILPAAGGGKPLGNNRASDDKPNSELLAQNCYLVKVDVAAEIALRADWVTEQFLQASKQHLQALQQAPNHDAYVKNNFFDKVYPQGRLSGSTAYCMAAINRALQDANRNGDLDAVLPYSQNGQGQSAVGCYNFINFITKQGYGSFIERGPLNFSRLEEGDIVFTPRGGGNRHATIYIGNRMVRSFNRDGERKLTYSGNVIVIHMRQIAQKAILQSLMRQKLIVGNSDQPLTMELSQARKFYRFIYRGRTDVNRQHKTSDKPRTPSQLTAVFYPIGRSGRV